MTFRSSASPVLNPESIGEEVRKQLLLDRKNRLDSNPTAPKATKVKKQKGRVEKASPTLEEKPLVLPSFSVHPGTSIDPWGPMMQTGMITEAFRALAFYSHDAEIDPALYQDYAVPSVLHLDHPLVIIKNSGWPSTKCRFIVASRPLETTPGTTYQRWQTPAPSQFLIVDNYQYGEVRQITLLVVSSTQVPFFRSGISPLMFKLAEKARVDLHKCVGKPASKNSLVHGIPSQELTSKPQILFPFGDWQNNPDLIAWRKNS